MKYLVKTLDSTGRVTAMWGSEGSLRRAAYEGKATCQHARGNGTTWETWGIRSFRSQPDSWAAEWMRVAEGDRDTDLDQFSEYE